MCELGLRLPAPTVPGPILNLEADNSNYCKEINGAFREVMNQHQFAIVLLPTAEDQIFDHIKWIGETRAGVRVRVLTHCMLSDTFARSNDQYLANNAMKVNLKFGGVNQTVLDANQSRLLAAGNTMVVGLDVTHPSSTDPDTFPSIAAIAASTDARLGQWPG